MSDLRTSPLDTVHRSLGARMVPFGGWDLPVSYPAGTIAEHMACREGAALFDVSHLGTLEMSG
ncbi:MAG: glycine cleavage system protein T, partial [Acidimicrobiales bacterium]|nr:glycine cleavage system protein T [Acidimicrobiales bacterium]